MILEQVSECPCVGQFCSRGYQRCFCKILSKRAKKAFQFLISNTYTNTSTNLFLLFSLFSPDLIKKNVQNMKGSEYFSKPLDGHLVHCVLPLIIYCYFIMKVLGTLHDKITPNTK